MDYSTLVRWWTTITGGTSRFRILFHIFLDQELVQLSLYSSCSCSSSCCWGHRLQKSLWLRRLQSSRDEIWQDIVLKLHTRRLTESDMTSYFQGAGRPWRHFIQNSGATWWWVNTKHLPDACPAASASFQSILHSYVVVWQMPSKKQS